MDAKYAKLERSRDVEVRGSGNIVGDLLDTGSFVRLSLLLCRVIVAHPSSQAQSSRRRTGEWANSSFHFADRRSLDVLPFPRSRSLVSRPNSPVYDRFADAVHRRIAHALTVTSLAFCPKIEEGKIRLASGSEDRSVRIVDISMS